MDRRRPTARLVLPALLVLILLLAGLCSFAYVLVRDQVRSQLQQTLSTRATVFRGEFVGAVERSVRVIGLIAGMLEPDFDTDAVRSTLLELAWSHREIVNIAVRSHGRLFSAFPTSPGDTPPTPGVGSPTDGSGRLTSRTSYAYRFGEPVHGEVGYDILMPVFLEILTDGVHTAAVRIDINVTQLLERASVSDGGFVSIERYRVDLSLLFLDGTLVESSKNRMQPVVPAPAPRSVADAAFVGREWFDVTDYFSRLIFRADVDRAAVSDIALAAATGLFAVGVATVLIISTFAGLFSRQLSRADALTRRAAHARYEALQARMDPHFVFNSLNQIVGFAEDGDRDRLLRSLRSLTVILHQAIRSRRELVRFREEAQLVHHYVELQRIHHREDVVFVETIDPEIDDRPVLRLCLQPIIENSFVHGMAGRRRPVRIVLAARIVDAAIQVDITDDGPGVPSERVPRLNAEIRDRRETPSEHIGLASVHRRLSTVYGEDYGIEVLPVTVGFHVRMRLPIIATEKTASHS